MTADEKIARISVKIKRAKKHFNDLEAARQLFLSNDPKPYAYVREFDAETGDVKYRMTRVDPVPADGSDCIGLIIGDIVHNLRTSFNHLAFELWRNGPSKGIGSFRGEFPFAGDSEEFERTYAGKVKGMSDDAIDAICNIEPYQGGKGAYLWMISKLDNIDKHHALLTGIVSLTHVSIAPARDPLDDSRSGMYTRIFTFGKLNMPGYRKLLKAGDVIVIFEPESYENVEPAFDVAFGEPKIVEGKAVMKTLEYMIQLVERTIVEFRPYLE